MAPPSFRWRWGRACCGTASGVWHELLSLRLPPLVVRCCLLLGSGRSQRLAGCRGCVRAHLVGPSSFRKPARAAGPPRDRWQRSGSGRCPGPAPEPRPHAPPSLPLQELQQHPETRPAAMRSGLAVLFLLMAALGAAQGRWVAAPARCSSPYVRRSPAPARGLLPTLHCQIQGTLPPDPCILILHSIKISSCHFHRRRSLGEGRVQASIAGGQPAPAHRYRWNALLRQVRLLFLARAALASW